MNFMNDENDVLNLQSFLRVDVVFNAHVVGTLLFTKITDKNLISKNLLFSHFFSFFADDDKMTTS